MLPKTVYMNPVLVKLGGRLYVAAGEFIEVPLDTKVEDISDYVSYQLPVPQSAGEATTFQIKGSGESMYTVRMIKGQWFCNCTGWAYRKTCRHVKEAKTHEVQS